jgi:hypothetical protein
MIGVVSEAGTVVSTCLAREIMLRATSRDVVAGLTVSSTRNGHVSVAYVLLLSDVGVETIRECF